MYIYSYNDKNYNNRCKNWNVFKWTVQSQYQSGSVLNR